MTDNYFDGEWRPVIGDQIVGGEKLKARGFELGVDDSGNLMARWPQAPAARGLTFTGIPLAYWQEECRIGALVSLQRLRAICRDRGADYELTLAGLQEAV